jgi:sugar lactone lactonase YvrE
MTNNTLTGIVQSGGTTGYSSLPGAQVTIYEATTGAPNPVGTATSGANGIFSLTPTGTSSDSIFYALAILRSGVTLATIIGSSLPDSIIINELTTVAAAYSFAQFLGDGKIAGNASALQIAAGMNDNLVSPLTGKSSEVLTSSPNGDQTNSLRLMRALANLIAACIEASAAQQTGAQANLFAAATTLDGVAPTDTLQALVHIARHPGNNVPVIYALTKAAQMYEPTLESMPDAWTIAVKVNDAGGGNTIPFGGPANIVFDSNGYAWVTNNVVQGTPNSTTGIIVLKPNGKPADGENGITSPITGGGILGTGFGIDIDPSGSVWIGNFGWGPSEYLPTTPTGNGSVSQFSSTGVAISVPEGYQGGTYRAQAVVSDQAGNIWIASFGNNRVVVFPGGDPNAAFYYPEPDGSCPFGIAIATDGTAWVTNSGGLQANSPGGISRYEIVYDNEGNPKLNQLFTRSLGQSLKGLSIDSQGNIWVPSGGENCIYLLSSDGELVGQFSGGGIMSPWGTAVDGDDNVWVANFGPMVHGANYIRAGISKLAGVKYKDNTKGFQMGDAMSPSTGYTLPSGGDQVLLYNGDPLYGPGRPPSYSPLTRMTNVVIDAAGNIWAINNWKPSFDISVVHNPGGDGIVIFVGLAKPTIKTQ